MSSVEAREEARRLRRAVARLQRAFRATRDIDGPTPAQLSALGTLRREGAMATGDLAMRERLKPQSVTRLVAGLLERKLIRRTADRADRRRLLLEITIEGDRQLRRELQRRDERLAWEIERLSRDEREILQAASGIIDRLGGYPMPMKSPSDDEMHSVADDLPPLSERESEVMGRQTERKRPGHNPAVDTVYGDVDGSVENEGQTDEHSADWKDIV